MPEDRRTPSWATDENKARYVPSNETAASYHCPATNCDGHYYIKQSNLGRDLTCPKCGLAVTIGKRKSRWWLYFVLPAFGMLIGYALATFH
jgi:hypothetical protein